MNAKTKQNKTKQNKTKQNKTKQEQEQEQKQNKTKQIRRAETLTGALRTARALAPSAFLAPRTAS